MVYFLADLQALHLEYGHDGGKPVVRLCDGGVSRGFGESCVGLERFMEKFDLPPFWVGRADVMPLTFQLATDQIPHAFAAVFLFLVISATGLSVAATSGAGIATGLSAAGGIVGGGMAMGPVVLAGGPSYLAAQGFNHTLFKQEDGLTTTAGLPMSGYCEHALE